MLWRSLRRRLAAALLCATVVGTLGACTPGTEQSGSPGANEVEIIVSNFPQLITAVEQTLDTGFTERTGIEVELIKVGDASYAGVDQRVQNDLIAGRTPQLAITGLNSLRTYADAKSAAALNDVIERDGDFRADDYYPQLLDLGRFDDTVYGIPYGVSTYTLYCNAGIFEEAGLDPNDPPTTFSEVRSAANAIVASGAADTGIVVRSDHVSGYGFQNFLTSAGGSFMNEDETDVTFNSPEGVAIVEFWADLHRTGAGRALSNDQAGDAFTRGDTGMVLQSSSYSVSLKSQTDFEIRSAPFPIPDGGRRMAVAGGPAIVSFAKDPAMLANQWTVIKELISARGVTNLVSASGFAPINKRASQNPEYLGGYLDANPLAKPSWDQMASLAAWYQFPGRHNVEIGEIMSDHINRAIADGGAAQAALDAAATDTEGLLP